MASVPKATTVATAMETSSARPRTTGSVAITAAAPQIELPAPMSIAVRRFKPKSRVPAQHDKTKVLLKTMASIMTPTTPTCPMS